MHLHNTFDPVHVWVLVSGHMHNILKKSMGTYQTYYKYIPIDKELALGCGLKFVPEKTSNQEKYVFLAVVNFLRWNPNTSNKPETCAST